VCVCFSQDFSFFSLQGMVVDVHLFKSEDMLGEKVALKGPFLLQSTHPSPVVVVVFAMVVVVLNSLTYVYI
jgi:hypothetical protein